MTAPKLRLVQQRVARAADKSVERPASRKKPETSTGSASGSATEEALATSTASAARKRGKPMLTAREVMSSPALSCQTHETLNRAAQLLWENNLGALVVVDEAERPVSMITDRDICFGAYTQGVALWSTSVGSAMAPGVITCIQDAPINEVRRLMSEAKVRRVPIVDADGKLVGIVGAADLCRPKSGQKAGAANATEMLTLLNAWVSPPG